MRNIFQRILCVIVSFASLGCHTSQNEWRQHFLTSHKFQNDDYDLYFRRYRSLSEASRDLGFPISDLRIPPNGPGIDVEDKRVVELHDWVFVVTAEKGHTLDDSTSPCTVSTALLQVSEKPEVVKTELAKKWSFNGTIREKSEWKNNETSWTTIFVKIDTDDVLPDEFRLIYNPTSGVIDVQRSRWMDKPMPTLKCPPRISDLVTAKEGKRCRLTFTAPHWDLATKDSGQIELKSFQWIQSSDKLDE